MKLTKLIEYQMLADDVYPLQIPEAIGIKAFRNICDGCYMAGLENCIIISFQGSKTMESWARNLKFWKVPLPYNPVRRIHAGFYQSWQALKAHIVAWAPIIVDSQKPVYSIGHSAGGVLAILFWRYLKKYCEFLNVKFVTFGCPDFGNKAMVDNIESLKNDRNSITQVVNGYDLVPSLLDNKLGYEKLLTPILLLKQPWWHRFFRRKRDHDLEEYYKSSLIQFSKYQI